MSEDDQIAAIVERDKTFGKRISKIETVEDVLHATLDGNEELSVQWEGDSDSSTMANALIAAAKRRSTPGV